MELWLILSVTVYRLPGGFGSPAPAVGGGNGFGGFASQPGGFGAFSSQSGGFGAAASQGGGFGAAATQGGGFGAAATQGTGFGGEQACPACLSR